MLPARLAPSGEGVPAARPEVQLSTQDLALINAVQDASRRLARAVLLLWARAERRIAPHLAALSDALIRAVSAQLGLTPEETPHEKVWTALQPTDVTAVQDYLRLRPFTAEDADRLRAFIAVQVAQTGNVSALLDAADAWIVRQGILRPMGRTTVERIIYQARHEAEEALFKSIASQLSQEQCARLDALCQTEQGKSTLADLVAPPHATSTKTLRDECQRLGVIRDALPAGIDWGPVQTLRLSQWAAIVRRLSSQALRRYPPAKRYTLLLAFLAVRSQEITDAIVEMFETLIGRMFAHAEADLRKTQAEQAQTHLTSARLFRKITQVLLDPNIPSEALRDEIFQRIPRHHVGALVAQSQSLDQSEIDTFFALLKHRYPQMRESTRLVLQTVQFRSALPHDPVLEGLETLRAMDAERRKKVPKEAPLGFVPQRWLRAVAGPKGVDRRAWELTLLSQLRLALRSGDIIVQGSQRYARPESYLYAPADWQKQRVTWLKQRGLPEDGAAYLAQARAELHDLATRIAGHRPENILAQVQEGKLLLLGQEELQAHPAITSTRRALTSLLPRIGLADLLMAVDSWTQFTSAFSHLTARREPTAAQLAELRPPLLAVLVAEATNVSLTTMADASGIPYGQLVRVYDWYIREETLRQASQRLIRYQQNQPLAGAFGAGTLLVANTLEFDVLVTGSTARQRPPSLGARGNVTLFSQSLDQGPQLWMGLVNPLIPETAYLLDGLEFWGAIPIREQTTELADTTDLLFGLCDLLGYHFAPQLHDLSEKALTRPRDDAFYGWLDPILRQTPSEALITTQWGKLNWLAASLKDHLAAPSLLISKFQAMRHPDPVLQALQELGRIARTRYILHYLDDPTLRQRVLMGLNRARSLEALAYAIFFGKQGRFADRGDEARLHRALALSLVMNAIIVWNTSHLEAAAETLKQRGQPVPDNIWPHLSPILWEHLHLTGEYSFDSEPAGSESE
jgi:TnpA family transposase